MDPGTGVFDAIDDGPNFSGTITVNLQLINIPTNWAGRKFRCRANGSYFGRIYTIGFSDRWIGLSDNNWENPLNWSCGVLPDANTDVYVDDGTVELNSNTTISTLNISTGANVIVHAPYLMTVLH